MNLGELDEYEKIHSKFITYGLSSPFIFKIQKTEKKENNLVESTDSTN